MNCDVLKMRSFLLLFALLSLFTAVSAQTKREEINFGDVKPADFAPTAYAVDSSADAVYLFDGGYSQMIQADGYYFNIQFTRHARIRLLKQSSFTDPANDVATIKIPIQSTTDYAEKLVSFKAALYYVENGSVMTDNFDIKDMVSETVFKTKERSDVEYKFTFPKVKEGCIIEYSYTFTSPGNIEMPAWIFQNEQPCLWSEYEITQPDFYVYLTTIHGSLKFDIDSTTNFYASYNLSESNDDSANTINRVWAIKNVKPLKKEPYTTSLKNYASFISFYLYGIRHGSKFSNLLSSDWHKKAGSLLNDEDFGIELRYNNNYLKDELATAITGSHDALEKAKRIYKYVQNNFSCTEEYGIYLSQPIKDVFKAKKGGIADINLMLTAMFLSEGFDAKPVILSTRSNGIAPQIYPEMNRFNYVVSLLNVNGQRILLDGSEKLLAFGHLPEKCYNGPGRIIDTACSLISLSADSVKDSKLSSVFIFNGDKGMVGNYTSTLGYFESADTRKELQTEKQQEFFSRIKKSYLFDVEMTNTEIDSLDNADVPVTVKYDFAFSNDSADNIYFNPMLTSTHDENPFKSAERVYPVEMPYCSDEIYTLNMEIPKGYTVDELPKSARVSLPNEDAIFQYTIAKTDTDIQLNCRLKFNKANFDPDAYDALRSFYTYVVKKEDEQIVFKKIK